MKHPVDHEYRHDSIVEITQSSVGHAQQLSIEVQLLSLAQLIKHWRVCSPFVCAHWQTSKFDVHKSSLNCISAESTVRGTFKAGQLIYKVSWVIDIFLSGRKRHCIDGWIGHHFNWKIYIIRSRLVWFVFPSGRSQSHVPFVCVWTNLYRCARNTIPNKWTIDRILHCAEWNLNDCHEIGIWMIFSFSISTSFSG